ncbi:MAG: replicative DNA helicase [Planctomycetes bacterium]|nr:replicative DNA helicase [Planctomycetota bacterium]
MPPDPLAAREPPQDLEAERALLGSILIDDRVTGEVLQIVEPASFYHPGHRTLFETCVRLYDARKPIDARILHDALATAGTLEAAGGADYIAGLFEAVPSAANAEHYAEIVREKFIRRELIRTCYEVLKMAAEGGEEPGTMLDRAERMMFDIVKHRAKAASLKIGDILREAFQRITDIRDRKARVTGLETGFYDIDDLTTGFHPSQLIVVAGRPSMGKSSLALNVALHAGVELQKPVLFFSLEMDAQNIARNMLCTHARFDSQKIRKGLISEEEYAHLMVKAGKFTEAPIFIDDTSGLSALELRARARRFKAENDIQIIFIDYMQLMEVRGGGRGGPESRQQEIAMISRSLKALARELEVPVIALSQLSRQVESRESHRPVMSDLRECVTGDTPVMLADGRRVPIRDLVGRKPMVWTVNERGKVTTARSDRIWSVGRKPVLRITLASGRELRATSSHRLYGASGWLRVSDLQPGDRLALSRTWPEPRNTLSWPVEHLQLLGQLIGDGSYLVHQPLRYTTSSPENSRIVARAARILGSSVKRYEGRGRWHQLLLGGNGNRWHPRGVNRWLRKLGIYGQQSHEKRLPEDVFRLPNGQVAVLLRHLWATDGSITLRRRGSRGAPRVYFATSSRGLALDVVALLLRFGIVARIRAVTQRGYRPVHTVDISGGEQQLRFLERVGAFGPRCESARRLLRLLRATGKNPNVDTLPVEVFDEARTAMKRRGVTQRGIAAMRGTSYGGTAHFRFAPSRDTISSYAGLLQNDRLRSWSESDLFWDRILKIEPAGVEPVYDLTVPKTASWLADGIVSHNSGAIEQDADVIMMLYRDEYYDPDTPDKNTAEVIIAKQRNGPTGTVKLRFLKEFMRFENATGPAVETPR